MTTDDLRNLFEEYTDKEFLKFDRVKNPANRRPDICAFVMLDAAVPGKGCDMVSGAEHDEIYLNIDPGKLAEVATRDLIRDLVRCGVRYSSQFDCLAMFV